MQLLLRNIGEVFSGDPGDPTLDVDAIGIDDGRIVALGADAPSDAATVIDCRGATVAPGLVDTHVHPTVGDFAPKQHSVGYLERMLHGAVTRAISAGEVHLPGRTSADAAVAIATASHHSYASHRPGGMKVHGGGLLLEKDMDTRHIDRAFEAGVRIIGEVGVGSLKDPERAGVLVGHARDLGMTVHMHCGATSDRGPGGVAHPYFGADDVATVRPTIASHANTFASLSDEDIDAVCANTDIPYVEIVQAGGTRPMIRVVERLTEREELQRLLIGTDTPTGYGITTLGILKTLGDICSLGGVAPALAWALASGGATRAFGIEGNEIAVGMPADLVVMDASLGSTVDTAAAGLSIGDFPGVGMVITDGEIRVDGSECTLRSARLPSVEGSG